MIASHAAIVVDVTAVEQKFRLGGSERIPPAAGWIVEAT